MPQDNSWMQNIPGGGVNGGQFTGYRGAAPQQQGMGQNQNPGLGLTYGTGTPSDFQAGARSAAPQQNGLGALMGNTNSSQVAGPGMGSNQGQMPSQAGTPSGVPSWLNTYQPAISQLPQGSQYGGPGAGMGPMPQPGLQQSQPQQQQAPQQLPVQAMGRYGPGQGPDSQGVQNAQPGSTAIGAPGAPPQQQPLGALAANARPSLGANPMPNMSGAAPMGQPQMGGASPFGGQSPQSSMMQQSPQLGQQQPTPQGQQQSNLSALGANAQPSPQSSQGGYAPGQGPGALTSPSSGQQPPASSGPSSGPPPGQYWSPSNYIDHGMLDPNDPNSSWKQWAGGIQNKPSSQLTASQQSQISAGNALSPQQQMQAQSGRDFGAGLFQMPSTQNVGGFQGGPGGSALYQNMQPGTPFPRQ